MLALTLATSASLALVHQPAFAFMPRQVRSRSPMVRTRGEVTLAEGVQNAIPDVPTTPATASADLVGAVTPTMKQQPSSSKDTIVAAVPMLTMLSVLSVAVTWLLARWTGPIAGAVKLIYAGAIAGIISRSFCAPLEMVSTIMMCRGNEASGMMDECVPPPHPRTRATTGASSCFFSRALSHTLNC